jgi:hypothetical protein
MIAAKVALMRAGLLDQHNGVNDGIAREIGRLPGNADRA